MEAAPFSAVQTSTPTAIDLAAADKQIKVTATAAPGEITPPATRSASPTSRKGSESFPTTPRPAADVHFRSVTEMWERLQALTKSGKVVIDGESLDIPSLVAVARYVCPSILPPLFGGSRCPILCPLPVVVTVC